jgi:hypothetical protein
MSCTVNRSGGSQPTSEVQETKPTENAGGTPEERKASYEETKASIKGMDDVLKQAQEADPNNKDIQKARDDLKELDKSVDDVYNTTEALAKANEGGNQEEIENAYNDAIDAQMKFGENYQNASDSLEKLTGQPLPPLE